MRLGIFGGTFNPIHLGHLRLAEEILEWLALDHVLFVPSGQPPLRPPGSVVCALHRYTMVALATAGRPRFFLSDAECQRPGPSYSVDTLEEFRGEWGQGAQLFFILGGDSFLTLREWRDPQRLLKQSALVLVPRDRQRLDPEVKEVAEIHGLLGRPRWVSLLSGSGRLSLGPGEIGVAAVTSLAVSGREIRRRVRARETIRGMVPELVEEYIEKHRLYREDGPPAA